MASQRGVAPYLKHTSIAYIMLPETNQNFSIHQHIQLKPRKKKKSTITTWIPEIETITSTITILNPNKNIFTTGHNTHANFLHIALKMLK